MRRYQPIVTGQVEESGIVFYLTMIQQSNRKLLDKIKLNSLYHKVQPGERLEHIAYVYFENENDWPAIAILNDLTLPWDIYPGQLLFIPPSADSILELIEFWQTLEPNINMYIKR